MNEDYLLPDDYEEETTLENQADEETFEFEEVESEPVETTTDEEETESIESTESTEETLEEPISTFKVPYKYNHQEGEITDIAEAQRLIQIGMMYQNKVQPEYEQMKSMQEPISKINKIAELYGMDLNSLHDALYDQYLESQSEETGYTVEQIRKDRDLEERESRIAQEQTSKQTDEANNAMYNKFLQEYPDITADKIKPETWAMVDKGIDLTTAYTKQLNNELKEQLKIQTQNTKNKSASPIKSTTLNGGGEPPQKQDDFLDGFWSN